MQELRATDESQVEKPASRWKRSRLLKTLRKISWVRSSASSCLPVNLYAMWKTLRRKRTTIASHAALSFWRHRSMSSASEGVAVPFCNDLDPLGTRAAATGAGRHREWNSDDSGSPTDGSNRRVLLELGPSSRRPGGVPVAAGFACRLREPVLQQPGCALRQPLEVPLAVAAVPAVRDVLLV